MPRKKTMATSEKAKPEPKAAKPKTETQLKKTPEGLQRLEKHDAKLKVQFLEILKASGGIATRAHDVTGVTRKQFRAWVADDPDFAEQADEIKERSLDFAEGALWGRIQAGDSSAIYYYLNNHGASRGYMHPAARQKFEQNAANGQPVEIKIIREDGTQMTVKRPDEIEGV